MRSASQAVAATNTTARNIRCIYLRTLQANATSITIVIPTSVSEPRLALRSVSDEGGTFYTVIIRRLGYKNRTQGPSSLLRNSSG